jgi:RES domain-containing protein
LASTPEPSAWRLDKAKWARSSFTGVGASFEGGRWNPAGLPVVYLSRHLPMAALEKLVHWPSPLGSRVRFVAFAVHFGDASIEVYPRSRLPADWNKKPLTDSTQQIGLAWAEESRSAILRVPSAIIPSEDNFLLNPAHSDFRKIKIARPVPFGFDPRLIK